MERKKLLIDFDDVICESVLLDEVNKFLGTSYALSDFKDYLIDGVIPKEKQNEFYTRICNINFYDNAKLVDGAKEALRKLNEKYEIYVCSSCVMIVAPLLSGPHFTSKYNFLIKNLPFLDPRKFVFTSSKSIICGDIFIDDYLGNLDNSTASKKLLFTSYHNKHFSDEKLKEKNIIRVSNWNEICKLLL